MSTETVPNLIPPGDYKVRHTGYGDAQRSQFIIIEGPCEGRYLYVPTPLVPDIILTVGVEVETTSVERNVSRFKTQKANAPFSSSYFDGL